MAARRPSHVLQAMTAASSIPCKPLRYLSKNPFTSSTAESEKKITPFRLDLAELGRKVQASEERRHTAFDLSRNIQIALKKSQVSMETEGGEEEEEKLEKELDCLVETYLKSSPAKDEGNGEEDAKDKKGSNRKPREANLSFRTEEFVRHKAFRHFLLQDGNGGKLLPPSALPLVTDEEYLAGACIGLSQDLAQYAVGRATVRDVKSVRVARDLVQDIMDQLLLFDFRNGPLRRKYDGTKYALKTLETILYELSVTGATLDDEEEKETKEDGPDTKRAKVESDAADAAMEVDKMEISDERIPTSELSSLRERMERRDEMREALIKRCRDGQKAAKQAIFALHRNDDTRASKLLKQCHQCITNDLLPMVEEEPGLRYGCFANVLEEYVEGKMFYAWLHGLEGEEEGNGMNEDEKKGEDNPKKGNRLRHRPRGRMLQPDDFHPIHLEPDEYIGGLCDLTGEIGRYAVQRGMDRDAPGVRLCLETNKSIMVAILTMERTPAGTGKKMGALEQSIKKLEKMLYELSLVEATGRNIATEVEDAVEEKNEENND
mmetsp:Transcript_6212/g.8158  ORF Transcript_6212/g.8158 Transcript_6212/m.8158 type:complete len:548 (+) Transcript_6212:50-1693(+)